MSQRIDAGVRWLDGYFGREGWVGTIDSRRLNLASGNTCMIGQLFRQEQQTMRDNFTQMIHNGTMTRKQATARGFYLPTRSPWPWVPTNELYTELTHLWIERIGQLRAAEKGLVPSPIVVGVPKK